VGPETQQRLRIAGLSGIATAQMDDAEVVAGVTDHAHVIFQHHQGHAPLVELGELFAELGAVFVVQFAGAGLAEPVGQAAAADLEVSGATFGAGAVGATAGEHLHDAQVQAELQVDRTVGGGDQPGLEDGLPGRANRRVTN
jgi:pyridoxal biosynthesis lyase PdxS